MSESLKSCPFCGGEAEFHVIANSASHGGASLFLKLFVQNVRYLHLSNILLELIWIATELLWYAMTKEILQ